MGDDCMWVFVSTFLATWFGLMVFDIRFLSKRKWVGLTDDEINELARWADEHAAPFHLEFAKAVERKLKGKNCG